MSGSAPIAANAIDGELSRLDSDESKNEEGKEPWEQKAWIEKNSPKSRMVSSYEEYLKNRVPVYEPWRSFFTYAWPKSNPQKYVAFLPAAFYVGFNKPPQPKGEGTIVENLVKRVVDGEEKDVRIKKIVAKDGSAFKAGDCVYANPNRNFSGSASDLDAPYKSPPDATADALTRDGDALEMILYEVKSDEEIMPKQFAVRSLMGLLAPLKWEIRTTTHIWNWGVGSTRKDFTIICTCFACLWSFVGLLYYLLIEAALKTDETSAALWMFFACMMLGWTFIGIALKAQNVINAQRQRAADLA
jgi:hypothetical protein